MAAHLGAGAAAGAGAGAGAGAALAAAIGGIPAEPGALESRESLLGAMRGFASPTIDYGVGTRSSTEWLAANASRMGGIGHPFGVSTGLGFQSEVDADGLNAVGRDAVVMDGSDNAADAAAALVGGPGGEPGTDGAGGGGNVGDPHAAFTFNEVDVFADGGDDAADVVFEVQVNHEPAIDMALPWVEADLALLVEDLVDAEATLAAWIADGGRTIKEDLLRIPLASEAYARLRSYKAGGKGGKSGNGGTADAAREELYGWVFAAESFPSGEGDLDAGPYADFFHLTRARVGLHLGRSVVYYHFHGFHAAARFVRGLRHSADTYLRRREVERAALRAEEARRAAAAAEHRANARAAAAADADRAGAAAAVSRAAAAERRAAAAAASAEEDDASDNAEDDGSSGSGESDDDGVGAYDNAGGDGDAGGDDDDDGDNGSANDSDGTMVGEQAILTNDMGIADAQFGRVVDLDALDAPDDDEEEDEADAVVGRRAAAGAAAAHRARAAADAAADEEDAAQEGLRLRRQTEQKARARAGRGGRGRR